MVDSPKDVPLSDLAELAHRRSGDVKKSIKEVELAAEGSSGLLRTPDDEVAKAIISSLCAPPPSRTG